MRDVIETGDMEQLAVIVLNGEGKKLLGQRSELPEIQAFLDNVPSYMVSFFFSNVLLRSTFGRVSHNFM